MDIGYGYQFLLVALILGLNSYFAAVETALISVRPSRLKEMQEAGEPGATAALTLLENTERMLSVGQVGLTLASLVLGWLGEATLSRLFTQALGFALPVVGIAILHGISFTLAFLLMTYLHVVIGEVVPKNLAIEKADRMAVLLAPSLLVFYRISEPFVWAIEKSSAYLSRLIGVRGATHGGGHSVEELKYIVSSSERSGHLSAFQEDAIQRLISFHDYAVREVMIPRGGLVTAPINASIEHLTNTFSETKYSRLPIYEGARDNLVGIVHVKDVLEYLIQWRRTSLRRRNPRPFDLRRLVRKVPVVPETKPMNQLLDLLREERAQMAFVVDEFGTIIGMISMEDAMEHVFGEIQDEFDTEKRALSTVEGDVTVEGTISLVDLETHYGISPPEDLTVETLAGFLMHELHRIPKVGDVVTWDQYRFTVEAMTFNRVDSVHIDRVQKEDTPAVVASSPRRDRDQDSPKPELPPRPLL